MNKVEETILIVDDIIGNIDVLNNILKPSYKIKFATDGEMALRVAFKFKPDLILLDIMMPKIDGYEVCRKLKENPVTKNIPVIFVTGKDQEFDEVKGFEVGAVDYIVKPVNPTVVKARVKTHLFLYDQKRELDKLVREKTNEINKTRLEIIKKLGVAAEYKDNETGKHILRMRQYCNIFARKCGFEEDEIELLINAASMHDVGKIGIPDYILQKKGLLSDEERKIMKTHCDIGYRILSGEESNLLKMAMLVALEHHEKWDGTGYPKGLKGEEINIFSRIVAIADVFDALISKRPYKKAWEKEKVIEYIKNESGKHFDPELVKIFEDSIDEIINIKNKYEDSEYL